MRNLALIAPFLILSPDPAKLDVNDLPADITSSDTSVFLDIISSTYSLAHWEATAFLHRSFHCSFPMSEAMRLLRLGKLYCFSTCVIKLYSLVKHRLAVVEPHPSKQLLSQLMTAYNKLNCFLYPFLHQWEAHTGECILQN